MRHTRIFPPVRRTIAIRLFCCLLLSLLLPVLSTLLQRRQFPWKIHRIMKMLRLATVLAGLLAADVSLVGKCSAFPMAPSKRCIRNRLLPACGETQEKHSARHRLYSRNDSDEEDTEPKSKDSSDRKTKSYTSQELYEREQEASRKTMNNLLIPTRLNNAITATLYALVLLGVVLNLFGYDYYLKDGQFVIDTLDNRRFENEVRRVMKTQKSPESYSGGS